MLLRRRFSSPSSIIKISHHQIRSCSTSSSVSNDDDPLFAGHLRIHHDSLGTGRFVAVGMGKENYDDISIVVTCDVSERVLDLKEHLLKKKRLQPNDSIQPFFSTSSSHQEQEQKNSYYQHDPHSGRPGKITTKKNVKPSSLLTSAKSHINFQN